MTSEQLYQNLKEVAEKLKISVSERQLQKKGLKAKSGLCTVKGQKIFFMDRRKSFSEKNELLGQCLSQLKNDDIYLLPAVRDFLEKCRQK